MFVLNQNGFFKKKTWIDYSFIQKISSSFKEFLWTWYNSIWPIFDIFLCFYIHTIMFNIFESFAYKAYIGIKYPLISFSKLNYKKNLYYLIRLGIILFNDLTKLIFLNFKCSLLTLIIFLRIKKKQQRQFLIKYNLQKNQQIHKSFAT